MTKWRVMTKEDIDCPAVCQAIRDTKDEANQATRPYLSYWGLWTEEFDPKTGKATEVTS